MQVRKKSETGRKIITRNPLIRITDYKGRATGNKIGTRTVLFHKRNRKAAGHYGTGQKRKGQRTGGVVRKTRYAAVGAVLRKETELVSHLNPEQKRRWNSYTEHEKRQLMEQVETTVQRRLQYQRYSPIRGPAVLSSGRRSDSWEEIPEVSFSGRNTFRNQNDGRSWKKEKHNEKQLKKYGKQEEKLYRTVFLSVIDKDVKKHQQIKEVQKKEQIEFSMEELTRKQGNLTVGTVMLPIRYKLAKVGAKVTAGAAKLVGTFTAAAAKYAAMLGIPILTMYLLLQIIAGVLGGIAGDEEPFGSGLYSANGDAIAAYAQEWCGITQYVWGAGRGGPTDWQDAADCSSFVYGVYHHFGIPIGGTAWGGTTYTMEGQGTLIARNSLTEAIPGDIILFFTPTFGTGNSVHVGIYAGNGQMVHNSSSAGCVVLTSYMSYANYEVRRFVTDVEGSENASGGHRADPGYGSYSVEQIETIWAVVGQEDNGSYEGALAVASCIMNRTESPSWSYNGSTAWQQMTAYGQFCYSMDNYWRVRLGGNVPSYVKQAVHDCLVKGIRNHTYTSFRSTNGSASNYTAVQIGGNWYFGH